MARCRHITARYLGIVGISKKRSFLSIIGTNNNYINLRPLILFGMTEKEHKEFKRILDEILAERMDVLRQLG